MDINSWLTIITVFIAVLAFFPNEERKLLEYKLGKIESGIILISLVVIIPYLILFPKLMNRIHFLKIFTVQNGIDPSSIAFGIFYIIFIWILIRLFWIRPKNRTNKDTIEYYTKLLSELPFNKFFSLFTRYTPDNISKKDLGLYEPILFNPVFLKGVVQHQPSYLSKNWSNYNNESDFRSLFSLFLADTHSAYYREIKENKDSNQVLANSPFLQTVLVKNLKQNIDNEIFPLMYDTIQTHLKAEKLNSIYNQQHDYKFIREEQGYDLPIYFHIKFIGLLYSNAICNKTDIGTISTFNGHMRTLLSEMIARMISNMQVSKDSKKEYETNYHWLIAQTFDVISNWLELFGSEHPVYPEEYENGIRKFGYTFFEAKSTYKYFIPQCFANCLEKLYEGFEEGKITQEFINMRFHYDIMSYYYEWYAIDDIRTQIEEEIIAHIPQNILPKVLEYSLDEEYATHYSSFKEKKFHGVKKEELEIQKRLWSFLNKKDLLG
jgi:hypothetical protein